ncbi:MAG: ice-binding family protein [Anaerolineales bacterium]
MNKSWYFTISIFLAMILSLAGPSFGVAARPLAASAPNLGAAGSFSVLGFDAVTNTGPTTLGFDLGVWSGSSITGLATITVGGAVHQTDTVAQQAQADATAAVGSMTGQAPTSSLGALDSVQVGPGVYDLGAGSLGGGVLTLDGEGVYIFRASSSLTTSGSVSLINGARACDVYWQVDTQANLTGGSFVGTIIAGTGVVFGTGVSLNGRALAIGGPVTLDSNTITGPSCPQTPSPGSTAQPSVSGLPSTGGAPIRGNAFPWGPVVALGFAAFALVLGMLAFRRIHLPKQ